MKINGDVAEACASHLFAESADEFKPLPEASLPEMLEAARMVREYNEKASENLPATLHATVAGRGIAAIYAYEKFSGLHGLIGACGFCLDEE